MRPAGRRHIEKNEHIAPTAMLRGFQAQFNS
jgi:hypothetical protein